MRNRLWSSRPSPPAPVETMLIKEQRAEGFRRCQKFLLPQHAAQIAVVANWRCRTLANHIILNNMASTCVAQAKASVVSALRTSGARPCARAAALAPVHTCSVAIFAPQRAMGVRGARKLSVTTQAAANGTGLNIDLRGEWCCVPGCPWTPMHGAEHRDAALQARRPSSPASLTTRCAAGAVPRQFAAWPRLALWVAFSVSWNPWIWAQPEHRPNLAATQLRCVALRCKTRLARPARPLAPTPPLPRPLLRAGLWLGHRQVPGRGGRRDQPGRVGARAQHL